MKYYKKIKLKDGRDCCLRNGDENDGEQALRIFNLTHEQTDNLLSYPDECNFTIEQEAQYLREKTESENEIEIIAVVDNKLVGMAGIEAIGPHYKVQHRAEFGVSIDKNYWDLGIGKALLDACIECAKNAGYAQLELSVVADNEHAIHMYKNAGFVEFASNPKGFRSRISGYQELISMRLELL